LVVGLALGLGFNLWGRGDGGCGVARGDSLFVLFLPFVLVCYSVLRGSAGLLPALKEWTVLIDPLLILQV
jgi:hypothetical protein